MVRLNRTYYSLLKFRIYKQNFQNCIPQSNSSELCKFHAVRPPTVHEFPKICTFFRHLPRQRTLQNSSELRKFCTFRPHSPQITRNSHILLTYSTLCFRHLPQQRTLSNSSELRKFHAIRPHSPRIMRNSHHLLTLHPMFQMPDQWQTTP